MPTFSTTSSPTIVITTPVEEATVNTLTPFISWAYGSPAGRVQGSYELDIYNSSGTQIYNGSTVTSSANSATVPGGQLVSGNRYTIRITVTDSGGFTNFDTVTVYVLTNPPTPPTGLSATALHGAATVTLSWTPVAAPSNPAIFVRYELTRSTSWEGDTEVIAKYSNRLTSSHVDYFAPSGGVLTYGIRTVTSSGEVETTSSLSVVNTTLRFRDIWLTDIIDPTYRVVLVDNTSKSLQWTEDKELIRYWNSSRPVSHKGEGQYRTMTISGMLFGPDGVSEDHTERWRMFEELVRRKNTICYRDGRGRHMFVDMNYTESDSLPSNWTINATLTEVTPPDGVA